MKTATIIVMHDRLKHNRWILESYYRTVPPNQQLIVADNASSDGTREFLQAEKDANRIDNLLLLDENLYIGGAWNRALGQVAEDVELVGKVDNDAYFVPGWHQRIVRVVRESNAAAVIITPLYYDWPNIWHQLGDAGRRKAAMRQARTGICFHRPGDYGGVFYVRRQMIRDGLRYPAPRRMTLDSNKRCLDGVRRRRGIVVRLVEHGITWEKVRMTDPDLAEYYERTFKARGILGKLRKRQARERREIAAGEITADA